MKKYLITLFVLFLSCARQKEIKIGVIMSLTGDVSSYGETCLKGIKLAEQEIKKSRGGYNLELFVVDDYGSTEGTIQAVKELIEKDVDAIIGPLISDNVIIAGDLAQCEGIPLLAPAATAINVTEGRPFVWRLCFTDADQGERLAEFAKTKLNAQKVIIVMDFKDPYSRGLSSSFREAFELLGGKIISTIIFRRGEKNFIPYMEPIKRLQPDCVFIPAFYPEAGLILAEARKAGITIPFLGGDGWDSPHLTDFTGENTGINYFCTHFYPSASLTVTKFTREFKTAYGILPNSFAALGYDALMLLANVCDGLKGIKIKEANKQMIWENLWTAKLEGVTGTIVPTSNRNVVKEVIILKLEAGELSLAE